MKMSSPRNLFGWHRQLAKRTWRYSPGEATSAPTWVRCKHPPAGI